MNIGWNINCVLTISSFFIICGIFYFFLRLDWKRYGVLLLLSAVTSVALCYVFVYLDFYTFPYLLIPAAKIPFTLIITVFPLYVLFAARYSPIALRYKLTFYMALVHFGVFSEAFGERALRLIQYSEHWHIWESYGWWWIFLLAFDILSRRLIPPDLRKPLDESFTYGRLGWFIAHFIFIATIFLGGVELGKTMLGS